MQVGNNSAVKMKMTAKAIEMKNFPAIARHVTTITLLKKGQRKHEMPAEKNEKGLPSHVA